MKKIERLRTKLFKTFKIKEDVEEMQFIDNNDCVTGTAFFPVGDGLYKEEQKIDDIYVSGIMIVGQDFGVVQDLAKIKEANSEFKSSTTWRNIKNIYFDDFNLPKDKCFFTNALMGLRKKDETKKDSKNPKDKVTGKMISYLIKKGKNENELGTYSELIRKHRNFFIEQVQLQNPKIIIFLGKELLEFCNTDIISSELKNKIFKMKISDIIESH